MVQIARDSAPSAAGRRSPLEIAWKRKSWIGLGIVAALMLGFLYYNQLTPLYQSKAQILIQKKRPDSLTGIDTRNLSMEDYAATHKTLIESPTIIEGAIQRGNLARLESLEGKEDLIEVIQRSLTVTRNRSAGPNNNVLDLAFRTANPADAALVLNAIIESYKDDLDKTYSDISGETLKLITQAQQVLQQDLKKQHEAYRTFRHDAPLLLPRTKDAGSITQERLGSIESRRQALLVRKAEIRSYLQAIDAGLKDGTPQESLLAMVNGWSSKLEGDGNPGPGQMTMNDQLYALVQEEQKLLETRGENHSDVKAVRQRIELARTFLSNPGAARRMTGPDAVAHDPPHSPIEGFRAYLTQQLNHAEIATKMLTDLHKEQFAVAQAAANFEMEDEKFRRDISFTEEFLKSIVKKIEEVNFVKNAGGYEAKTITPPAAGKKVYPSLTSILAAAALLGGIAGFGLAGLAELRDKSFHNVEEIRARLGLPIVGQIPHFRSPVSRNASAGAVSFADVLCVFHQPNSVEAEAYRAMRTALYFNIHCKGHKVIQVTGASAGAGASTVAANLAISIAQTGKKVLLVDADLRKPTIHRLFGLSSEQGLSSVIAENLDPQDAIQELSIPGLSVLPSGPLAPNPAELLTSSRFAEFLDYQREHYDFVIFDTPSLLTVSDPGIVAHQVDGVFLTIRLGKNGRPTAERAKDMLLSLKVNIIGAVVNDADSQFSAPGHASRNSRDQHAGGNGADAMASNGTQHRRSRAISPQP